MTKTEAVIRSIFGAVGMDLRPLVYAVDAAIELLFLQGVTMDDICVTKDIYPETARLPACVPDAAPSVRSTARRVERLANLCWDALADRGLVQTSLGAPLRDIRAPRDMIFYLAYYVYLDTPFFTAVEQRPQLLF